MNMLAMAGQAGGKYTLFGPTSLPELLLTTTGRKSGQPRMAALSYLRDGVEPEPVTLLSPIAITADNIDQGERLGELE